MHDVANPKVVRIPQWNHAGDFCIFGKDSGTERSGDAAGFRTPGQRHTRDVNGFIVRINCSNQEGLTCLRSGSDT